MLTQISFQGGKRRRGYGADWRWYAAYLSRQRTGCRSSSCGRFPRKSRWGSRRLWLYYGVCETADSAKGMDSSRRRVQGELFLLRSKVGGRLRRGFTLFRKEICWVARKGYGAGMYAGHSGIFRGRFVRGGVRLNFLSISQYSVCRPCPLRSDA